MGASGLEPSTSLLATPSSLWSALFGNGPLYSRPTGARSPSGTVDGPGLEVRAGPRRALAVTSA